MTTRPFRFGLQAFEARTADEWMGLVRRVESLGYATLFSTDHYFGPGPIADSSGHRPVDMSPVVSIAYAAAVTTSLRVGCRVFACDYHHPVVLAKEMATLDLLSGGRLEVGLGAGWVRDEYDGLGITMARPGVRIERLRETVDLMRAHWSGEPIEQHGTHVDVSGFSGRPLPVQRPGSGDRSGPPIMIGGGSPKVLGLAGAKADIVSVNFDNSSGRLGGASVAGSGSDQTARKIEWIRAGAGDRLDELEIEIGAYFVAVGDDAPAQLETMAQRFGVPVDDFATHPHALFGSVDQVCETLLERRERFGVSYVTVAQRYMEAFAPIVAELAGH